MDNQPSTKQLQYLGSLGYEGKPPSTKSEASVVITALQNGATPKQAESLLAAQRDADRWDELSENHPSMLCIYRRGKDTVVDVLECRGASGEKRGLRLHFATPTYDKQLELLDWDKDIEIREQDLLWYAPLDRELYGYDLKAYGKTVAAGLKIARQVKKGKTPDHASGRVWRVKGRKKKAQTTRHGCLVLMFIIALITILFALARYQGQLTAPPTP